MGGRVSPGAAGDDAQAGHDGEDVEAVEFDDLEEVAGDAAAVAARLTAAAGQDVAAPAWGAQAGGAASAVADGGAASDGAAGVERAQAGDTDVATGPGRKLKNRKRKRGASSHAATHEFAWPDH